MNDLDVLRWVDSKIIHNEMHAESWYADYGTSINTLLTSAHSEMSKAGHACVSVVEGAVTLKAFVDQSDAFWFVGPTWISVVGEAQSWHDPEPILVEEIVGPRFPGVKMDMEDYLDAMQALATRVGFKEFQIGTLASSRKEPLSRYLTSRGMGIKTIVLSKKV